MFKKSRIPIIALILVAVLSFGIAFGVFVHNANQKPDDSNSKPPDVTQPTDTTPPATEPIVPYDEQLCGKSLLGVPRKDSLHPEFLNFILTEMAASTTMDACAQDRPHFEGLSEEEWNTQHLFLLNDYKYLDTVIHVVVFPAADNNVSIGIYGNEDSVAELEACYSRVEAILTELQIDNTVTQVEAIKRINQWVVDNKEFELDDNAKEYTLYASMFNRTGVCYNYALMFQMLCQGAGIDCEVTTSWAMNHAWNKVNFADGTYFWIDCTWNDDTPPFDNRYLMLSDEQFFKDHWLQGTVPSIPNTDNSNPAPVEPVYGTAADTDMCGESLLLKEQPHTQFKNVIEYVLRCLNTPDNLDNLDVSGLDEDAIIREIKSKYKYLTDAITVKASDGEVFTFESDNYTNQLMAVVVRAEEIITELGITENTTQVEAIKRINQWLIDNKNYDFTFSYTDSFVFVGLYEPDIICCHYSLAFQALCLAAGIECEYIEVLEMNHAWNKVIFSDGSHLWVDTTWNDCHMDAERYLLLTDAEMAETHQLP